MMKRRIAFHWQHRLSPAKLLIVYYVIALVISTSILSLPIAYQDGVEVAFIDILFTAVSALSVTGLSTISITETFSNTGIILLSIILHLGLLGVMTISTMILIIFGRKIGIAERRLIMQDQNLYNTGGMVYFIKQIVLIVLTIEIISIVLIGCYLTRYYPTVKEAFFQSYFLTISALSNSGFSLRENSLGVFAHDYFLQLIVITLVIFGAIGYPVLVECKTYLLAKKRKKRTFRFSLFSKLTTTTFFILVACGTIFIYIFDYNRYFADKSWLETFFYALFQSVTTRSAGLTTMDVTLFSDTNQLFMSFLMFIGASPSSSGGGIRTTTFALVIIFILTYARGGKSLKIFHREVHDEDLQKAVVVMLLAIGLVFFAVLIMSLYEPFTLTEILFEVTSAFGTVGLSQGITSELSTLSKILIMLLMFLGRIGLITFILTFRNERKQVNVRYPKERIIIG